ncbi:fungal-specific transcription factor domain-containing protein [Aspergillus pseudodeflectus]|uniref:Fungal-specific transcription factor domain-containing protein n=1 Tax=Aspergillus pseudodeflectus TaxID=176178 RepID=A0ABR4KP08_9EURO
MNRQGGTRALARAQRTSNACEYCREKKIRCDSAKPSCSTCTARGRECRQHPIAKKPRPTNSRIRQLERENQRLLHLSGGGQPHEASANRSILYQDCSATRGSVEEPPSRIIEPPSFPAAPGSSLSHSSPRRSEHQLAEIPQASKTGYHGPTSAMYDETTAPNDRLASPSPIGRATESQDDWLIAEAAKERHMEMMNMARGQLDFDGVDPGLGMHLLSLFWTRHLHAGFIVYRPAFMRDMACKGPYFSKLLLNAMFYSVSKHSPRTEIQRDNDCDTAGWSFRLRFTELLRDEFDRSSIPTIQALLIMASSLFTRCDERSTSWLYAGNAFNMAIDLGLHVELQTSLAPEEREVRRRVFWASYLIDKIQCLYQGRQPCLRFADTDVPLRLSSDFEDYERFDHVSFSQFAFYEVIPSRSIQILQQLCKLSIIMEHIYSSVYAVKKRLTQALKEVSDDSDKLQAELQEWRSGLPADLDFDASKYAGLIHLPFKLSMLALWNVLVILLHRPLVSDARLHSTDPERSHRALTLCSGAANEITSILRSYAKSYDMRGAPFLLSYSTYIAATIHVHVLAKYKNASDTSSGAAQALQVCLWSLDGQALMYSAAEKAKAIIVGLTDRMNVKIPPHNALPDNGPWTCGMHSDPPVRAAEQFEQPVPNTDFFNFEFDNASRNLSFEFFQAEAWMDFDQGVLF